MANLTECKHVSKNDHESYNSASNQLSNPVGGPAKFIFSRLSVLMLLEFIVFGSWFATLGLVLFTYNQAGIIGMAYTLCAIAAIVSPLVMGAIGDRLLSSEKLLGLLHLLGAIVQCYLPTLVSDGNSYYILCAIFIYMFLFQPTLGLVNSISLVQLHEKSSQFPYLRTFATLGWVVAGMGVGALGLSASHQIFYVTAASSLLLALYAFTLPVTKPKAQAESKMTISDMLGGQSFQLFKEKSFSVLMICALLTSISLGFYNTFSSTFIGALGIKNVAGMLSIGQISEIIFIISVPFVISKIGMKNSLLIGIMMWGIRFVLFIMASNGYGYWTALLGVALHGICNDYFIIISAMYIYKIAPVELNAQAQSWLIIMISGFGAAFGSSISGYLYSKYVVGNSLESWAYLWVLPIVIAVITSVVWIINFRESE
ncbi:MFS transporter [Vibrio albus]|uniref:MFS transporter n=1 Tax=Vibrio albus TaxID=2200953 RepID=A0A2U3B9I2_9VIBR|nr:MFS transporter [Vibrio albus]PWI33431.1 MFS transporter [Vibrio albus]